MPTPEDYGIIVDAYIRTGTATEGGKVIPYTSVGECPFCHDPRERIQLDHEKNSFSCDGCYALGDILVATTSDDPDFLHAAVQQTGKRALQ